MSETSNQFSLAERPPPSFRNKMARALWGVVWLFLYRPSPRPANIWRRTLLRLFGAKIGPRAAIYPSARIWAPWNFVAGSNVTVGPGVEIYNVASVILGDDVIISQRAFLCSASHDVRSTKFTLIVGPIVIRPNAWVAAEAFVGPGIMIGESAVVGARSVVTRDVDAHSIVTGNPAKVSGTRPAEARNVLGAN
jgi:putative colanic acid biosynthesis acetyltransferase WcaF